MPRAIDIHVHPSTHEWLVDGLGPFKTATEKHFRTEIPVRSVDEMADEFRADDVLAVLFAWDAESAMALPPTTNDFVAGCVEKHPDALLGFASVDPWKGKAAVQELRRAIADLGLRGLKLHPTAQAFQPNDQRFYPIYETAADLDIPIVFHSGTTGLGAGMRGGGGLKLGYSRPIFLDDVAADFPELDVIAAHPSVPWQGEAIAVAQHKTNFWIDLSGWSPRRWEPELKQAVFTTLQDRVLFGTDYPFISFTKWLDAFRSLDPPEELEQKVLLGNAQRLLGLTG